MAITPGTLGIDEPATIDKRADANSMTRSATAVLREVVSIGSPDDATPEQLAGVTAAGNLQVAVNAALPAGANNIGDVDVLTQPARSHTTDSTRIGDGTDLALVTAAGELAVLASAQPGVDIGDTTVNNAAGASAVNIQDGGNSITIDGTVTSNAGTGTRDVQGNVAHDAVDSGNPIKIGGKAADTGPVAVAAADRVDAYLDRQGRIITRPWGGSPWSQVHFPAVGTRATTTKAAGAAGNRHVCTGITVILAAGATAPAAVQLDVRLRDGIADTGTILWQAAISLPATAGAMNGVTRSGLHIQGTAATAMTLEFGAAGGSNTFESVSIEGMTIIEA